MLNLIFRGFIEWIYGLIMEMWEFIAGSLLDIMGLDFAYLQSHIPVMDGMAQVIMAAGWALLLGNLVFQALKSMAAGLGFEGEDPKLLFARTFVFAFLLLASPQICRIGLDLTSNIMALLDIPDATNVTLVDESVFGTITAAWLMAIICSVIVMFKVLGLLIEIAERYVILAMLALTAPLAFAMGGSKNTASIFTGWCRMFGSMCLLVITNLVCFKMLFSVLSTVPSGLDVLPWMVLIFAIVKVAHKADAIITRIGLNPAITGGGRSLLSTAVNTAVRTATSQVTQKVMGGFGGGGGFGVSASSGGSSGGFGFGLGSRFSGGGFRFGGARGGGRASAGRGGGAQGSGSGAQGFGNGTQGSGSGAQGFGNGAQGFGSGTRGGRYSYHSTAQQGSGQQSAGQQASARQGSTFQASAGNGAANTAASYTAQGGQPRQARKSSVPPVGQRPRSYVPPTGASAPGATGSQPSSRPGSPGTAPNGGGPRPSTAGNTAPKGGAFGTSAPRSGGAGTGTASHSARSTHSASHTTGGSTVYSASQASTQTKTNMGGPAPNAPAGSPHPPHPGGPRSGGSAPQPGPAGIPPPTRPPPRQAADLPARRRRKGASPPLPPS